MKAGLLAAGLALWAGAALAAPVARWTGTFDLPTDQPYFGGFSGLQFSPDGRDFIVLSDRGALVAGQVSRDAAGAITAVAFDGPARRLTDAAAVPLADPYTDSEGLRISADGNLLISFEQMHRIARFDPAGRLIATLPVPLAFADFPPNSGIEALALASDGAVFAIPEGDAAGQAGFPIYRLTGDGWAQAGTMRGAGTFRPVDAQFGRDGRLYVLERDFWPLAGFRSRLHRLTLAEGAIVADEELFASRAGRFGNLEGLSLWHDAQGGLHVTLVDDNNFLAVQQSAFVDLAISE